MLDALQADLSAAGLKTQQAHDTEGGRPEAIVEPSGNQGGRGRRRANANNPVNGCNVKRRAKLTPAVYCEQLFRKSVGVSPVCRRNAEEK
jgi:hypothetical protein